MTTTWEEYLLRDELGEFVDGEASVIAPTMFHQRIARRLDRILSGADAEVMVFTAWLLREQPRIVRIPDLMLIPTNLPSEAQFTGTPLLAVEILSSDRRVDLYSKAVEYAAAGLPRYWTVDPRDGALDALILHGGGWHQEAHLDAEHPTAPLETGAGTVTVDLGALFA